MALETIPLFFWNDRDQTAFGKVPVVSIEQAAAFKPDLILIAVSDAARSQMLMDQVKTVGYGKKCMLLHELYRTFDIRSATLHRMAKRVSEGNIPGDIAELGVYRGNIAWQLNALFPDRQLLLFDTFEGFSRKDIQIETDGQYSKVSEKTFSDTFGGIRPQSSALSSKCLILSRIFSGNNKGYSREVFCLYQPGC